MTNESDGVDDIDGVQAADKDHDDCQATPWQATPGPGQETLSLHGGPTGRKK